MAGINPRVYTMSPWWEVITIFFLKWNIFCFRKFKTGNSISQINLKQNLSNGIGVLPCALTSGVAVKTIIGNTLARLSTRIGLIYITALHNLCPFFECHSSCHKGYWYWHRSNFSIFWHEPHFKTYYWKRRRYIVTIITINVGIRINADLKWSKLYLT